MELTSAFAEVPGLKRKHWLANEENNIYGEFIFLIQKSLMMHLLNRNYMLVLRATPHL